MLEPAWKAVLASKKLLLVLQELYPGHPCLPRVSDRPLFGSYAIKPVFGREGANVIIVEHGRTVDERPGLHQDENVIYQELVPLLRAAPGFHAQCGVWMVGPEAVGMGIREDTRPILGNTSRFMPHIIA